MYTIRIEDKDYQCQDLATLQVWVNEGRISSSANVYDHQAEEWKTVAAVLQLVPDVAGSTSKPPESPVPTVRRKRQPTKYFIVGGVVLFILVAAWMGYSYWRSTPTYAFSQMKTAIDTHNRDLFYEYVDVDTLVKRSVDVLLQELSEKKQTGSTEGNKWEQLGQNLAMGLVEMFKPKLVEMVKDQIDKLIETSKPTDNEASGDISQAGPQNMDMNLRNVELANIEEVIRQDKITVAVMSGRNQKYDVPFQIRFKFRQVDAGHLKLIEIENLGDIIKSVNEAERKWKLAQNKPIRDRLSALLKMSTLSKRQHSDRWGFDKKVTLILGVENISDTTVEKFNAKINLYGPDSVRVLSLPVRVEGTSIPAGYVRELYFEYDINQFIEEQKLLWDLDFSTLTGNLTVVEALLTNGEVLTIPYPDVEEI